MIIVGLGPTGATLAGLLGQAGLQVAVFDRLPDLYPLPRAIGLDQEAMRIVQELGLAERMAPHIAAYRPSEYRGMDGGLIKRLDTLPPPHRLGWEPNYVFDQPSFERVLRARLAEMPNVQVFLKAQVEATGQQPDAAWAQVTLAGDTQPTRFEARYLVACDGGASPIRKRLGITLEDLDFDEHWLVVDAVVPDELLAHLPQTQVQYCEAGRPATFVVGPGNHRRWEIMLLEGDSLSPDYPPEQLWPLLERWIRPGQVRLWRAAAYRFHGLLATQWRQGRILLAGDAAHMTPPFMAQGMVSGLRDAHNLAWKLRRVLAGRSSDALLDSYAQEREPHVRQTILTAMALGRIICERDPARARERDARLRAAHGGLVKTEYRQNMIPDLRHGLIAPQAPLAGTLFPQPRASAGDTQALLDDLTGARVRIVVRGALDAGMRQAFLDALAPLDGVLVQLVEDSQATCATGPALAVVDTSALIASWLAELGQQVAIVRPDHYVYGAAEDGARGLALLRSFAASLDSLAGPGA